MDVARPGFLALPDLDDPYSLVGRTCGMDEEALRGRLTLETGRETPVIGPAGRDVLHERVRHAASVGDDGSVPV